MVEWTFLTLGGISGPVVANQIISIVSTDDYAGVYMILCLRKGMNMDVVQLFVAGERGLGGIKENLGAVLFV